MSGSAVNAEKESAPEPAKKKRKVVVVRKVIVKKSGKEQATPAPAPVPEAGPAAAAAAASGGPETHAETASDTTPPTVTQTLEAAPTIPETLPDSDAPKQAVWKGWDRYRVQRHFDRPGHAPTRTDTPSAPAAPVPEPAGNLAPDPPSSDAAVVALEPEPVAGAGHDGLLDNLEEELGEIMDAMEISPDTPAPAAVTSSTPTPQWHPAHDLVQHGKSLKAWISTLPGPEMQKVMDGFRCDSLLPGYEGIYGKLPDMGVEWMDYWVNFSCWKITQHPEHNAGAASSDGPACPTIPPTNIWHPDMRKAMRGVAQAGLTQPHEASPEAAGSAELAVPPAASEVLEAAPETSATSAGPEAAPAPSAVLATSAAPAEATEASAVSATSAGPENATEAPPVQATTAQAEATAAPEAASVQEAVALPGEQAHVPGTMETSWGEWTDAEWKAWRDGTWWNQSPWSDWSAKKHTHSTPPESAAGTPMKAKDLRDALSRLSTVDLEGTPKTDPDTPPPPPATPAPTPEEKKKAAQKAHARYMKYYRSTRESADLRTLNLGFVSLRPKHTSGDQAHCGQVQRTSLAFVRHGWFVFSSHVRNQGSPMNTCLFEAYLQCGGNWKTSKLYLSIVSKNRNLTCGVRRWMNRTELEKRFGGDVAESIIERKMNDEELKKTETRLWKELPDREDGCFVSSGFFPHALCVRTFGNSWSLMSRRRWKSKKRWSSTCSKQLKALPLLKQRAHLQPRVGRRRRYVLELANVSLAGVPEEQDEEDKER